ncbi:fimbrial protein [Caballeronia terrestris]|jgi:major type 1 subunit fimbrin (pilin)|uniref:Fimbrial protein n=1 Tax=Caballeronia terrestris TaxID=1226301 RepID=A0A158JYB0_9BURK|nr:fimbrial protein [Caballeronia terrestris]SAL73944.1 fimbrial protein [Caballeronia terrestris]
MKSFLSNLSGVAVLGAIAVASTGAQAADGTITFTGAVSDTTCSIDAQATGAGNKAVTLPTVSSRALGSSGATAGTSAATDLTFALTGCSAGATKAIAHFENGPTIDQSNGYLKNQSVDAGAATNVQVRLLNASLQPINVVTSANNDLSTNGAAIVTSKADLKYFAEYYATGVATAGPVSTSVQYTMQYQ